MISFKLTINCINDDFIPRLVMLSEMIHRINYPQCTYGRATNNWRQSGIYILKRSYFSFLVNLPFLRLSSVLRHFLIHDLKAKKLAHFKIIFNITDRISMKKFPLQTICQTDQAFLLRLTHFFRHMNHMI